MPLGQGQVADSCPETHGILGSAEAFFHLLFLFSEVEEDVLRKADSVFFGEVYATVIENGAEFFYRRVCHSDHHFGLSQRRFTFFRGEFRRSVELAAMFL